MNQSPQLVEHFFRHEYGRLIATLSRRVGVAHMEAIEDAASFALMTALETWRGVAPENPSAWVHTVARNRLLEELRRRTHRSKLLQNELPVAQRSTSPTDPYLETEVQDDLLKMLFACCEPDIPAESQLVLALKTLCGFDVREIAHRLFISEANVYQRLSRAKVKLRNSDFLARELTADDLVMRRPRVLHVLYLLFTEGYLSSKRDETIRRELCDEAIFLTQLLTEHPSGAAPESAALLALFYLHSARLSARQDEKFELVLLEEQDRSLWDRERIAQGLRWLAKSAEGDSFSRYHAEAGIAAEHCVAPSFERTNWTKIVELYRLLIQLSPSPLHDLGLAVALAEKDGAPAGLTYLESHQIPTWFAGSYLRLAVLADLYRRAGKTARAAEYRRRALEEAPSPTIADALRRRLAG